MLRRCKNKNYFNSHQENRGIIYREAVKAQTATHRLSSSETAFLWQQQAVSLMELLLNPFALTREDSAGLKTNLVEGGAESEAKNIPHEGVFRGKLLLGGKAEDMSER